jgi:hypothetical protein
MCAMERKRLRSMAVNATGLASELSQIGRQWKATESPLP